MPRYGRNPAKGLEPRACVVCGTRFQPYRDYQIACRRRSCREKARDQSPARTLRDLICKRCGSAFQAMWSGMGRQPYCPTCAEEAARAKIDRANAARRAGGRLEAVAKARQFEQNFRRYGITGADFARMLASQNGVCAICGNAATPGTGTATRRLHVDHDHLTGKNRGLLCLSCNNGIGRFKDDPALLRAAAEYIERHRAATS